MENYLRMIEQELIINQKDYELSVKDAALAVKNKEIEEKNNTIKQLTEELQRFQSQYHDYKATCTKIIDDQRAKNLELQEKLDTLRSLSRVDQATIMELRDKLRVKDDKIEELSTKLAEVVVGNKKHDDEEKLKDRLSPASDKAVSKGPDKMPDYEGFRKKADEVQRKMMEVWEAFFNE